MGLVPAPPHSPCAPAERLWILSVSASSPGEGEDTAPIPEGSASGGGRWSFYCNYSHLHHQRTRSKQYFSANLLSKLKMWKAIRRRGAWRG